MTIELMGLYILMAVLNLPIDLSKPITIFGYALAAWLVGAASYYCLEKPLDKQIGLWVKRSSKPTSTIEE